MPADMVEHTDPGLHAHSEYADTDQEPPRLDTLPTEIISLIIGHMIDGSPWAETHKLNFNPGKRNAIKHIMSIARVNQRLRDIAFKVYFETSVFVIVVRETDCEQAWYNTMLKLMHSPTLTSGIGAGSQHGFRIKHLNIVVLPYNDITPWSSDIPGAAFFNIDCDTRRNQLCVRMNHDCEQFSAPIGDWPAAVPMHLAIARYLKSDLRGNGQPASSGLDLEDILGLVSLMRATKMATKEVVSASGVWGVTQRQAQRELHNAAIAAGDIDHDDEYNDGFPSGSDLDLWSNWGLSEREIYFEDDSSILEGLERLFDEFEGLEGVMELFSESPW